jgi:hypothetical protein
MFGGAVPSSEVSFLEKFSCHVNKNLLKNSVAHFKPMARDAEKFPKVGVASPFLSKSNVSRVDSSSHQDGKGILTQQ